MAQARSLQYSRSISNSRGDRDRIERGDRGGGGGPPSNLLLMELKHRILAALNKLSDRDTHHLAVEDLHRIVEMLSPEGIAMCLSCIYDTEAPQKSAAKKECVKMFGTLALLHGYHLLPHLSKIVASILRRLKDPDTSVREACVDAMGVLSSTLVTVSDNTRPPTAASASSTPSSSSLSGSGSASGNNNGSSCMQELTAFVKPIFDALYEQNRNLQSGAALCLARVITTVKGNPLSGSMARLCQRVCKLLTNPCFTSKSALLPVISSLSQIGAINQQSTINTMVPCVHEALESSDWATRKAAAETLTHIGSTLGPQLLSAFKSPTLLLLESCRFDKVKPVRDCVQDAIQTWKALPGIEKERAGSIAIASNGANNNRLSDTTHQKIAGILKKRGVVFADKIPNPNFFNKLETQNLNEWHVEVAVPRNCPPRTSDKSTEVEVVVLKELKEEAGKLKHVLSNERNPGDRPFENGGFHIEEEELHSVKGTKTADQDLLETLDQISTMRLSKHDRDGRSVERSCNVPQTSDFKSSNINVANDHFTQWDTSTHPGSTSPPSKTKVSNGQTEQLKEEVHGENWMMVQRQLSQLEFQQGALMDLLQEFMGNSKNSMLALESRIKVIERIVEDFMTEDLEGSASDCIERYNNGVGKHGQMGNGPNLLSLEEEYSMHSNMTRNMADFMTREQDIDTDQTSSDWEAKANHKMGKWKNSAKEVDKWTASFDRGHLHSGMDRYNNGDLSVADDEVRKDLSRRHNLNTDDEEYFMDHIDQSYEQSRVHASKLSPSVRSEDEDSRVIDFAGEDALDLRDAPTRWGEGLMTMVNAKGNGISVRGSNASESFDKAPGAWDDSNYEEAEKITAPRKGWERNESATSGSSVTNHVGLGEGPSARSVWQATKDEATLAAIRAGSTTREEGQQNSVRAKNTSPTKGSTAAPCNRVHSNAIAEDSEILKTSATLIDDSTMNMLEEVKTHQVMRAQHDDVQEQVMKGRNADGQTAEKRAYWKLWSRVMELVQADNIDSAYLEVLGSGDELMIVRLMNKTGPVLDKLSAHTANEMLHTVAMLLRQHGFFDFGLPWLQQVADLIVEMGPTSLDILMHVKDELLESIQEVGHMKLPAGWFGHSISELSSILMKAWSDEQGIDIRIGDS